MKIVFLGPSVANAEALVAGTAIELRPPAGQGDVAAAVLQGANVIGLIDGTFEANAATWHKEILFALSEGVQMLGAASMGALRAAECAAFGMVGIGEVFQDYASGRLVDDDAVAVIHAPEALGHAALCEPLVNVTATCRVLLDAALISPDEADAINGNALETFFKERTFRRIVNSAAGLAAHRRSEILDLMTAHKRDVKRDDAIALLRYLETVEDARVPPPAGWRFTETLSWRQLLDHVRNRPAEGA